MFAPIDNRLQFYVLSENLLEDTGNLEPMHKKMLNQLNVNHMIDVYIMFVSAVTAYEYKSLPFPDWVGSKRSKLTNYWLWFGFEGLVGGVNGARRTEAKQTNGL